MSSGKKEHKVSEVVKKAGVENVSFCTLCKEVEKPVEDKKQWHSSSSILLSQDSFGYLRFFVFPYKL